MEYVKISPEHVGVCGEIVRGSHSECTHHVCRHCLATVYIDGSNPYAFNHPDAVPCEYHPKASNGVA